MMSKVRVLLQGLERVEKDVDYYALDLSLVELTRTLAAASVDDYKHVKLHGLQGTYDDGLVWLKHSGSRNQPRIVLFLGSSVGNLASPETAGFMKGFSDVLGSNDSMIIGMDACRDRKKVSGAYTDGEGRREKGRLVNFT